MRSIVRSRCSAEPGSIRQTRLAPDAAHRYRAAQRPGHSTNKKGGPAAAPCSICDDQLLGAHQAAAAGAPDIDADEQEQPHHVDEVPVPGGELKAEVLGRAELTGIGAYQ